jgi:hypothetical protein
MTAAARWTTAVKAAGWSHIAGDAITEELLAASSAITVCGGDRLQRGKQLRI